MTTTLKWAIHDYHRMVEAGILNDRHVELLNGEIVEMAPEGEPHAHYTTEAKDYLIVLLGDQVKIREEKPITIPNSNSEPELDVAIVQPLGREYLQHHLYPENVFWLIEFSNSSLTKDLEEKSKIYAEAHIQEYWVINLRKMRLVVFRLPQDGDYASKETFGSGVIYPLGFPNFAIYIDQLLGR